MDVTREVVVDLLPVYLSGEASPGTRSLVEEFLKQDPELARKIREQWVESISKAVPSALPPELELAAFRRTRSLLSTQRWLMGLAMFFTALLASNHITFSDGRITEFHFLIRDYPAVFGPLALLGLGCWTAYFFVRRSVRTAV